MDWRDSFLTVDESAKAKSALTHFSDGGSIVSIANGAPEAVFYSVTSGGKPVGSVVACHFSFPDSSKNGVKVFELSKGAVWKQIPFTLWKKDYDALLTGNSKPRVVWTNEI